MHHYQKYLNDFFSEFRPEPNYPIYPPYHTGLYLEDYFYKEYNKENIEHIFYIPVSWTTTYIQNQDNNLQEKLNSLEFDCVQRTQKIFSLFCWVYHPSDEI